MRTCFCNITLSLKVTHDKYEVLDMLYFLPQLKMGKTCAFPECVIYQWGNNI